MTRSKRIIAGLILCVVMALCLTLGAVGLALIAYALGYFLLYRKGNLDGKKIGVIYSFLPKADKEQ